MRASAIRKTIRVAQFVLLLAIFVWLGIARVPELIDVAYSDLLLHGLGYAIAVISAYVAIVSMPRMWMMLALLWVFSFIIEVIQHYLSWRSFSVIDFLANGSGILAGFLLLNLLKPVIDYVLKTLHLYGPVESTSGNG